MNICQACERSPAVFINIELVLQPGEPCPDLFLRHLQSIVSADDRMRQRNRGKDGRRQKAAVSAAVARLMEPL